MTQTAATKIALERDRHLCQHCLYIFNRVRHIFEDFVWGYHPMYAGGHHALKRSRVDVPEAIITLCSECHYKVEHAKIKKSTILAILLKITGVDLYHQYPEFSKFNEAEWEAAQKLIV